MAGVSPPEPALPIRDGYDRWAAVYDHDANPLPALEGPLVQKAVADVRGLAVLDLGCGTGRHALWLAAAGARVTAVDFLTHDLHDPLPFPDGALDMVVGGLVLGHLRKLAPFFAEARRVLKADGRAVISAMHPAMLLRGTQARFTDPASGQVVQPGSFPHQLGAFVMAAVRAGFRLDGVDEDAPDARFADRYPRAEKYVGWPMVVVLRLLAPTRP